MKTISVIVGLTLALGVHSTPVARQSARFVINLSTLLIPKLHL